MIIVGKLHLNRTELEKNGIQTTGKVIGKSKSKFGYKIHGCFNYGGEVVNSDLELSDKNEYQKIKLDDKMIIQYLPSYPKNNRGLKIIEH